jgi:hypothetical protein
VRLVHLGSAVRSVLSGSGKLTDEVPGAFLLPLFTTLRLRILWMASAANEVQPDGFSVSIRISATTSVHSMASVPCPHCKQKTFTWWDKYRAGKWALLRCGQCGGRACAQPIVLAAIYFLYVWDVMLFGYLAYLDSLWYLLAMVVGWLILDYFTWYIPLSALRMKKPDGVSGNAKNR